MTTTTVHPAFSPRPLGRTGILTGRLGLASSYGCPASAVEEAFDLGLNYFYWGSIRRGGFREGLRAIMPQRERFTLVVQSYTRMASLLEPSLKMALHRLATDRTDVLLLGMWNQPVSPAVLDAAHRAREKGLTRLLAVSTHTRTLVPEMLDTFDIIHFRYNAVHTGAERDIFPFLPPQNRPGLVSYTSTSWKQLLDPRRTPPGERTPTAADCYRFVLAQPDIDVCMTAPANTEQFAAVPACLRAGPMNPGEIEWMRRVGSHIYKAA